MSDAGHSVKIKLQELMVAFDNGSAEIWNYLDLDTGEVAYSAEMQTVIISWSVALVP